MTLWSVILVAGLALWVLVLALVWLLCCAAARGDRQLEAARREAGEPERPLLAA